MPINQNKMFKGFLAIILIGAAIAVSFVWSHPFFQKIKDLKAQAASFNEALANSKQIQATRDDLLSQYNLISQDDLGRLNKILVPQTDSLKFVIEMEKILQRDGMILKSISITSGAEKNKGDTAPPAENRPFGTIPMSLKIAGSYQALFSFLGDMERNLHLTDINSLSFSSGTADFYEFNVEIVWYSPQFDKKEITAGEETGNEILNILTLLKTTKIDTGFFQNTAFKSLADFSVQLPSPETGRVNPFAPLEGE